MQQTEKYWNLINRIVVIAIVIMAGVGITLAFTPKVKQLQEYQERYDNLQHRAEITVAAENALKDKQRRFMTDPVFVERIAHEIGFAHKNEIIFYFYESGRD